MAKNLEQKNGWELSLPEEAMTQIIKILKLQKHDDRVRIFEAVQVYFMGDKTK